MPRRLVVMRTLPRYFIVVGDVCSSCWFRRDLVVQLRESVIQRELLDINHCLLLGSSQPFDDESCPVCVLWWHCWVSGQGESMSMLHVDVVSPTEDPAMVITVSRPSW